MPSNNNDNNFLKSGLQTPIVSPMRQDEKSVLDTVLEYKAPQNTVVLTIPALTQKKLSHLLGPFSLKRGVNVYGGELTVAVLQGQTEPWLGTKDFQTLDKTFTLNWESIRYKTSSTPEKKYPRSVTGFFEEVLPLYQSKAHTEGKEWRLYQFKCCESAPLTELSQTRFAVYKGSLRNRIQSLLEQSGLTGKQYDISGITNVIAEAESKSYSYQHGVSDWTMLQQMMHQAFVSWHLSENGQFMIYDSEQQSAQHKGEDIVYGAFPKNATRFRTPDTFVQTWPALFKDFLLEFEGMTNPIAFSHKATVSELANLDPHRMGAIALSGNSRYVHETDYPELKLKNEKTIAAILEATQGTSYYRATLKSTVGNVFPLPIIGVPVEVSIYVNNDYLDKTKYISKKLVPVQIEFSSISAEAGSDTFFATIIFIEENANKKFYLPIPPKTLSTPIYLKGVTVAADGTIKDIKDRTHALAAIENNQVRVGLPWSKEGQAFKKTVLASEENASDYHSSAVSTGKIAALVHYPEEGHFYVTGFIETEKKTTATRITQDPENKENPNLSLEYTKGFEVNLPAQGDKSKNSASIVMGKSQWSATYTGESTGVLAVTPKSFQVTMGKETVEFSEAGYRVKIKTSEVSLTAKSHETKVPSGKISSAAMNISDKATTITLDADTSFKAKAKIPGASELGNMKA